MTFPVPAFVRIEYWNAASGDWVVAHAAHNLMDPQKYITKLGQRGQIARAIDKDTEQVFYSEGADLL